MTTNQQDALEAVRKAVPSLEQVARLLEEYEQSVLLWQCKDAASILQTLKDGLEKYGQQQPGGLPATLIVWLGYALKCADEARLLLAAYQAVCQASTTTPRLRKRQAAAHALKALLEAVGKVLRSSSQENSSTPAPVTCQQRTKAPRNASLRLVAEREATPQEDQDEKKLSE
jgi:hypothetical protein